MRPTLHLTSLAKLVCIPLQSSLTAAPDGRPQREDGKQAPAKTTLDGGICLAVSAL